MNIPQLKNAIPPMFVLAAVMCGSLVAGTEQTRPTPKASGWFAAQEVAANTFRIDDHGIANVYLVLGKERALLIDTGSGAADLLGYVKSMTSLPLTVVNTHGHPDHVGANYQFGKIMASKADFPAIRHMATPEDMQVFAGMLGGAVVPLSDVYKGEVHELTLTELKDGEILDLGGRQLEVINAPGHTPGEIVLLDKQNKLLFAGDNSNSLVWLHIADSLPLETYLKTLEKVETRSGDFSTILPGHGGPIEGDFVGEQIACVKSILDGTAVSEEYKTFAGNGRLAKYKRAAVAFDPNKLHVSK